MKKILKFFLVAVLGWQVKRLRRKNNFKIIGVTGSIGKTSTKLAVAKVLASEKKVRFQDGNYNDAVSVPLVFFGHKMPNLWNIFAWLWIILKNEFQILLKFPFDFVVIELGTDAPGQINEFKKYLHLDLAVLTAIAPEHMEFFKTMELVAEEEWSVRYFSDKILANRDLCKIVPENLSWQKVSFYGKDPGSNFRIENILKTEKGFSFSISHERKNLIDTTCSAFSEVQLYSICAAAAVSKNFDLSDEKIKSAIEHIESFSGRMQRLQGIKNSVIIDDSYNASPDAMKIALDALYAFPANQRIAVLGMMNELGELSETEHRRVGKYCNPKYLDLLVTVGKDANAFLAPVAKENGCLVYEVKDSNKAGILVSDQIKPGAVILAKGSQNGVFVEEAIKQILQNKEDVKKLVRQDEYWIKKKTALFT